MPVLVGFLLFLVAVAIAAIALPLVERAARGSGLVDHPGGRKDHGVATPYGGGVAVLLAVALPSLGGLFLAATGIGLPAELAVHGPGMVSKAGELLGILLGAGIMLILGHLDDRIGLSAWLRLAVQVACAAGLVALGIEITAYLPGPWLHALVTVVFVVFVTNATNFIDNMNGLSGGVSLIAALHLLTLAAASGQLFLAAILICLAGGLCVFLPRNFPEARVFLGDAGTLALGFLLAAITVLLTFAEGAPSPRPVLLPLAVLAVPLVDGMVVVAARLARGVHPFTAGHDHLSHRLVARGLSRRSAVLVLWAVAFFCGLPTWILPEVGPATIAAVWAPPLLLLAISWMLGRRP